MDTCLIKEYPVGTLFDQEELDAVKRVLESGVPLTRGPDVDLFEKEFAEYCHAKHAIAVSSCGAALTISSQVLNLKPGDEVICQANAFWVTYNHLLEKNVRIVCVDIDPDSLNIDPYKIKPLITKNTKAIYLVHHGGNPANLELIKKIAWEHGIVVVEDCAHAVGAEYQGRKIGSDSDIACFSFSTLKNISTLGEGGMFVTNNETYVELAKGFRTNFPHGIREKKNTADLNNYSKFQSLVFMPSGDAWDYDWLELEQMGSTYRMSTPQAAVGRVQLRKLDSLIKKREDIANRYNKIVEDVDGLRTVRILPDCKHAWQLYSYFLNQETGINRNEYVKYMKEQFNIQIIIRYFPIHLGGIMRMNKCGNANDLKNCERVWFTEQLSLPISPQVSDEEIEIIGHAIRKTMAKFC